MEALYVPSHTYKMDSILYGLCEKWPLQFPGVLTWRPVDSRSQNRRDMESRSRVLGLYHDAWQVSRDKPHQSVPDSLQMAFTWPPNPLYCWR